MRSVPRLCLAVMTAVTLAGCVRHTDPVPRVRQLAAAEQNFESLWRASLSVLRSYRFTPDVEDRRAAVIKTEWMTSAHFTEFWRHEAITRRDVIEDSIHTIYRSVVVELVPVERGGEKFRAAVQVNVARSDRREPLVTTASQAYDLFSVTARERLRVGYGEDDEREELEEGQEEPPVLVQLGRDRELEEVLAAEISVSSGMPAAPK